MLSWIDNLHPLLGTLVLFGITVSLVLFVVWMIAAVAELMGEVRIHRRQFRKYFGMSIDLRWFFKDTSYKSWRDEHSKEQIIIQFAIYTKLFPLAKNFLDPCKERDKLMAPYYSLRSGEEIKVSLNIKKDFKKLKRLENQISLAESKFQKACKVAREGGFKVKDSAREYIKKETKQVVKKEKES